MDRRKALKNLGLSAGFVVATPTFMSLLQSCTTDVANWTPVFFTVEQGTALKNIIDIIIPKTDTPSASEVNVAEFIDKYADEVLEVKDQELLKFEMAALVHNLKTNYNEDLNKITPEDYEALVAKNLKPEDAFRKDMAERVATYQGAMDRGEEVAEDTDAMTYSLMGNLRWMTINAWKNSEMIGEQVLVYDPVPGGYNGCGSLEELTGGKAWSL